MFFINTKFGFISELYEARDDEGKRVLKAKHCLDVREAMPFETRGDAEAAYRKTYMATWWHCVVSSEPYDDLLRRAADSLQDYCAEARGDMNDSLAMEIYKVLGK